MLTIIVTVLIFTQTGKVKLATRILNLKYIYRNKVNKQVLSFNLVLITLAIYVFLVGMRVASGS